ncbi:YbaN family protein [Marinobacter halotolerans]|uniref:YbaN family protein n=1 Tax=Marinobacter halotolerans TaxID=1569211 RepID=UPI001CD9A2F9|nr:YbaN family protein [Marinobacter halotolerans]
MLAYISGILALVGVVLPLLPTTPFVLLACFLASKGSPDFADWLESHPRFGPAIEQWRDRRVVPLQAKLLACGMMGSSWLLLVFLGASGVVIVVSGIMLFSIGIYLLTRPSF